MIAGEYAVGPVVRRFLRGRSKRRNPPLRRRATLLDRADEDGGFCCRWKTENGERGMGRGEWGMGKVERGMENSERGRSGEGGRWRVQ